MNKKTKHLFLDAYSVNQDANSAVQSCVVALTKDSILRIKETGAFLQKLTGSVASLSMSDGFFSTIPALQTAPLEPDTTAMIGFDHGRIPTQDFAVRVTPTHFYFLAIPKHQDETMMLKSEKVALTELENMNTYNSAEISGEPSPPILDEKQVQQLQQHALAMLSNILDQPANSLELLVKDVLDGSLPIEEWEQATPKETLSPELKEQFKFLVEGLLSSELGFYEVIDLFSLVDPDSLNLPPAYYVYEAKKAIRVLDTNANLVREQHVQEARDYFFVTRASGVNARITKDVTYKIKRQEWESAFDGDPDEADQDILEGALEYLRRNGKTELIKVLLDEKETLEVIDSSIHL